MAEEEEADFISKKVNYMSQAIYNKLGDDRTKQFTSLTTDDERFSFIWNMEETHEVIQLEPEFDTKDADKARIHREKVDQGWHLPTV